MSLLPAALAVDDVPAEAVEETSSVCRAVVVRTELLILPPREVEVLDEGVPSGIVSEISSAVFAVD